MILRGGLTEAEQDMSPLVDRVLAALRRPSTIDGHIVRTTGSVGVAHSDGDTTAESSWRRPTPPCTRPSRAPARCAAALSSQAFS